MPDRQATQGVDQQRQATLRNATAEGADREALRFTAFCADRLATQMNPAPGDKVLDVSTGTGALAVAVAQAIGPTGRVTAIDLAEKLLARLAAKISKFGIATIDVHAMDAAHLDFRRDYFQHAVCSLGLIWLPDPFAAVREWVRVTRPGGSVSLAVFAPQAFQPLLGLLRERIAQLTGCRDESTPWEQLSQRESLITLLQNAGLVDITVREQQLGYHLRDPQEWWDVVWYSALRLLVERVPVAQRERLRTEHLAEVAALVTTDGLWLDVMVQVASGRKPTVVNERIERPGQVAE
jgi:ubiquinone/menaquinone biosynthesis C-methylase UbiE